MLAYLGQGTAGITDQIAFPLLVGERSYGDIGAEMVLYMLSDTPGSALLQLFATRQSFGSGIIRGGTIVPLSNSVS